MPQHSRSDYAPFFGDELADAVRTDGEGRDISLFVHVVLPDLADLQRAISAISRVRNKSQAYVGLSPEQYAARQQLLLAARSILVAERNKIIAQIPGMLNDSATP